MMQHYDIPALCIVTVKPSYQLVMATELNPLWFSLVMQCQNILELGTIELSLFYSN